MWATQGNVLRSSLSLGNEAPEKADEKIGRKVGRGTLGVERRGGLESESTQALFKAMTTGLRTTGRGKVKVQEKEKAEPRGPGRDPWLGRRQQRQGGAAWLASGPLGSLRRWLLGTPSLSGALFLCRETRKLPFDCGSPGRGLGARQRGSEWQRGKGRAPRVPAACRVRSPPRAAAEAAAAAALARPQLRGKRAAPAGRAERATSGTRGALAVLPARC